MSSRLPQNKVTNAPNTMVVVIMFVRETRNLAGHLNCRTQTAGTKVLVQRDERIVDC